MALEIKTALKDATEYFVVIFKALQFWRREPPVTNVAELVRFVETRAKFMAQTTLFGYVRTRAGTRYVSLLEDPVFAESVNIAKWEIYLVCLADMAAYAVTRVGRGTECSESELESLAVHIVDRATGEEEIPKERPQGFEDVRESFRLQAKSIVWRDAPEGDDAFQASLSALVEWAPIADELKQFDVEIVKNSMRFKWKKVRDQYNEVLDAPAVMADWRSGAGVTDSP